MSRNDANQQAAKASLIQIIHIVFQRLIVGDSGPIKPIMPPDLVSVASMRDAKKDATIAQQIVLSVWESVMPSDNIAAVHPAFPDEVYAMPETDARCCCLLHCTLSRATVGSCDCHSSLL
jgi:hypothetical protein